MTFGHRHITPLLLALLLTIGVALAACSSPDEPTPAPDPAGPEPQTRIGLYLNLPVLTDGATATSRSLISRTPTDGPDGPASYDPGFGYENYIDLNGKDYRIYVFTPDNQLYTEVSTDSVDIVSWNFTQFSRIYGLSFPVDKNFHDRFNGQNLKLVVLANWHGVYPTNLHPMVPYTSADGNTSGSSTGGTSSSTGGNSSSASGSETASYTTLTDLVSCAEDAAGFMNCKVTSTGTAIGSTDIAGNRYSPFPATAPLTHDTRIPLFGVTEFQTVNILTNLLTWLGNVDLLRAVAKIDVYDAPNTTAPISAVSLTRYNTALAKAPAGITSHGDYVHGSYNPDYANIPTIPGSDYTYECADRIPLTKVDDHTSPDNGHYIIYVPEYRNLASITKPSGSTDTPTGNPRQDSERARLVIQYPDRDPYYVDFKYYANSPNGAKEGDHFNILRNYWYKFELNKILDHINVVVQMVPYAEVTLKPDFGLDNAPNYVPVFDDNGQVVCWYDPETGKYYGSDKTTEIANPPIITTDPATGWLLERDDNGQFICYHDHVNNKYYGWDRKTELAKPSENIDPETGWYILKSPLENGPIYYYYDRDNSLFYLPNKTTTTTTPFSDTTTP